MADEQITISPLSGRPERSHRQVEIPNPVTCTYLADDTDEHYSEPIDAYGKGRLTLFMYNESDQDVTMKVYGCHTSTSDLTSNDTIEIGTFDILTTAKGYETVNDPFPYYIVSAKHTVAPTDAVKKTHTLYTNLAAF